MAAIEVPGRDCRRFARLAGRASWPEWGSVATLRHGCPTRLVPPASSRTTPSGGRSWSRGLEERRALEPALGGRARPHHRPPVAARVVGAETTLRGWRRDAATSAGYPAWSFMASREPGSGT